MARELQGDGKAVFVFFIGAIITIVFLASIADNIFTQTNTASNTNLTVTVLAINTSLAIEGRDLIAEISIINSTNISLEFQGLILSDGILNGVKTVTLTANDSAVDLVGDEVNISYTYNPNGYIDSAGGRSIAALILIIGALAILVFGIVVFIKNGTLGRLMSKTRGN
ncbi:hypothetical protein LCGC14_3152030 [marine sediment metagenome]|uniref:Uncharacterized protein n=1 Tax=marine sediment metagenome TaxID=412755 RepID=A0A0F8YI73_9ZZZZ